MLPLTSILANSGKLTSELRVQKLLICALSPRFLMAELIARKAQHGKCVVSVAPVKLLKGRHTGG